MGGEAAVNLSRLQEIEQETNQGTRSFRRRFHENGEHLPEKGVVRLRIKFPALPAILIDA